MTFQEILEAAYDDQGYQISGVVSPNPSADVIARFKRWANEGLRDLLGRPRLAMLRHGSIAFQSAAGRAHYSVALAFDAIDSVIQPTNDLRLRNMTRDWYRSIDPGERSQGTSYAWIDEGYGPAYAPVLAGATGLWVESQSAADVTQTAFVRGVVDHGLHYSFQATLNGLTRVPISPYVFEILLKFYLSAPTAGNVILSCKPVADPPPFPDRVSGLEAGTTSSQFHQIRLWPTPSAVLPYRVDGQLKVQELIHPNDQPFMVPELYHSALVDWINFNAWTKNGDVTRAQIARANYERRLGELTNKMEFSADYRPVRGGLGPDAQRWTNLPGGYFPADGWGR